MSPPSFKLACGAIGRYDRELVLAIAAEMNGEIAIAHEDQGSILATDRDPVRWEAEGRRGFAWSERVDEISGTGIWRLARRLVRRGCLRPGAGG